MATANGFAAGPFAPESYDAAALILLAMQSAKSSDSQVFKSHMMKVANAPGEKIYPGELAGDQNTYDRVLPLIMLVLQQLNLLVQASQLAIMLRLKFKVVKTPLLATARYKVESKAQADF